MSFYHLHIAIIRNDVHLLHKKLINDNINLNFGISLHYAIESRSTEAIIQLLLCYGANVNEKDQQNITPLAKVLRIVKNINLMDTLIRPAIWATKDELLQKFL